MKWLSGVPKVVNRLVPYLALLLALGGHPECAALLQSVPLPVVVGPQAADLLPASSS